MSKCREIRTAIDSASRRTELTPEVESHLAECSECNQHARSSFQLLALLGSQPRVEVPSDFDFRLRARIARARDEQRGWRSTLAQFWADNFSWAQAGAAAAVLMAVTLSAGYYVRTHENAATGEIATVVTSAPQTAQPEPTATLERSTPAVATNERTPSNVENRNATSGRPVAPSSNAETIIAVPRPEVAEIAAAQVPGSQEILVYQPSQGGRPAGARSIIIPRKGQVAFGAQLASVREVSARPNQGTIETF